MTDYLKLSSEMEAVVKRSGHSFDTDCKAYRDLTVNAIYGYLNSMFPSYCDRPESVGYGEDIRSHYLKLANDCLFKAMHRTMTDDEAENVVEALCDRIPYVMELLISDIIAGYEGDPAAKSVDEIILAYPAFLAIGTFRIAHELYLLGHPVTARIMTEFAHRKTGIDIHPGATIGKSFFIDHGTGVVIGETTVIGNNVKLYQHVTLGAKSFSVADDGSLVKGIKRHPNIGNNVVIYAGATILGGDVFIGDNAVIGGNVWLTHSVGNNETVYNTNKG